MKIELWSIYFSPVQLGVAPLAAALAEGLADRGHEVTVVTSHPHYPTPEWGTSWRRARRRIGGVEVHELPVYPRRAKAIQRAAEEATYGVKQTAWALRPRRADVVIATVPSLMCLPAAMLRSRLYGTPYVVWLQDIISTGAATSGLSAGSRLESLLAGIERFGFRHADHTVVISSAFETWLRGIGVEPARISRIDYATRRPIAPAGSHALPARRLALVIGNIGLSQGLPDLVRSFERSAELAAARAELEIAGGGVQLEATRSAIESDRVRYLGLFDDAELDPILARARVGLVTQVKGLSEFNLPSKLLTYMAAGLPIVSIADPQAELSQLVARAGGFALSNADLDAACAELAGILVADERLDAASRKATAFARANFEPAVMAARFESVLERVRSPGGD